MGDYFRKLSPDGHWPLLPSSNIDEKRTEGIRWLEDLNQPPCPKGCHPIRITADDVITYAGKLRINPFFRPDSRSRVAQWTAEMDRVLAPDAGWSAGLAEAATLLSRYGTDARPFVVHQLAESLLRLSQLPGHVQRRLAVADAKAHDHNLDNSRRRLLVNSVHQEMLEHEEAVSQWMEATIAGALGGPLSSREVGVVADVVAAEGASRAADVLYERAESRALTQAERYYYHAMALAIGRDSGTTCVSDAVRTEVAVLYRDILAVLRAGHATEMVDSSSQAQPVGNPDQLHVAEAIAGRLYFELLLDALSWEQDPDRMASAQRTLEELETTLRGHLSARAQSASLPEAVHVLAFATSVARLYVQPGGILGREHAAHGDSIEPTLASVGRLVTLAEAFGPSDAVSAAVLAEFRAQLAWMGHVDAYRRIGRPLEALQHIQSILEPRYATTETHKALIVALSREAPRQFDANMHVNPRDVSSDDAGIAAGLSEFSQTLNSPARPWRRFGVDMGTTLTGAGIGFMAGGPPGAAVGAAVGGIVGEGGNVGLNAYDNRRSIRQAMRTGLTDVTSGEARLSLGVWGGSLILSGGLGAWGGWGVGNALARRFGTTVAVRKVLASSVQNPVATLQALRAGLPGAIFGTSGAGRSFYRPYWFRLGILAVGVDSVGLHRQDNGHIELRSDWAPDTWLGDLGFALMALSPQAMAVFSPEGRRYLMRWWGTELLQYPRTLARATDAALRGLVTAGSPVSTQTWSLLQWREGLRGVLNGMPQLANRRVSEWTLDEWWKIGTGLRSLQNSTSIETILAKESADFQTFMGRLAPWDKTMGRTYWWDGWRHARLSNMVFPESVRSLYKLAFMDTSAAAKAAGSQLPMTLRRGMDMVFGGLNALVDGVTRWERRRPVWESGNGLAGVWNGFRWETVPDAETGWHAGMTFFQSMRLGKTHAWLNGRFDAAAQAVRDTVPEFLEALHAPRLAKEVEVSAQMIGRRGFADLVTQVFGAWSETRTERYPTLALLVECGRALMSSEFIRAHRLGGLATVWDKISDGELDSWAGFAGEMAMWNYVTELLGFSTTSASDIGTAVYVFTMAQLRKNSGENLLDQDPNALRPHFYMFHAGFFITRLASGLHAPGMRFLDGIPFVRNTFPSITAIPPALRVGVDLERPDFRTPLGYLWSIIVPPTTMGVGLGDRFADEKLADASGYLATQRVLKFVYAAVLINPLQFRMGYITAMSTVIARIHGFFADKYINRFVDAFIGRQLFNKLLTDILQSGDPHALDEAWEIFCAQNTTWSIGGLLSKREKDEEKVVHPLQVGYRWEPVGLNAWMEWDDGREIVLRKDGKDKRGYLEKLADDNPDALDHLVAAYRMQMVSKNAAWRGTGWLDGTFAEGFGENHRDGKGMVIFAMIAKYYAWKATQGDKGWGPFVQLVNDSRHRLFWDAVPEFHTRRDIAHHVELMNDQKWEWKPVLARLRAGH